MKTLFCIAVVGILAFSLVGCSGSGEEGTAAETSEAVEATSEAAQNDEAMIAEKVEKIQQSGYTDEEKAALTKWATYQTEHDPDAVYTINDLPDWGNYRKLNFSKLKDTQLNRVIHQLKTLTCSCQTCGPEWTLDRCLVVKPECNKGLSESNQLIARERLLGQ